MATTLVESDFEGCGVVRLGVAVGPIDGTALLTDADGQYLRIDRADPIQPLKIVLESIGSTEDYDRMTVLVHSSSTEEYIDIDLKVATYNSSGDFFRSGRGKYHRREQFQKTQAYSDGASRSETFVNVYTQYEYTDYDENDQPFTVLNERLSLSYPISSSGTSRAELNGEIIYLNSSSSFTNGPLRTNDYRVINWETGELSPVWSIVVYEVSDGGESELLRFRFDSDPVPNNIRCLDSPCDENCLPTYDSKGALLCICRDDGQPNEIDDYDYEPYSHNTTQPRLIELNP